ncbi:MAG: hypothetical protein JSW41_03590 [Candidatus Aenigmatarchaeota archaeon]|nr:MAG: hypothetical protein JSW41_03590 [Candidatus Aenigmarchaeota archaeon]
MNIDWIIAIALFLIFVSWSFVYYMGFFSITPDMRAGVEGISDKVMDFLSIDVYDVPAVFNSTEVGSRVLYMDFSWPGYSKNSTRIFSGNQSLPCYISGNRVYWQADLIQGENKFEMRYYDENVSLFCNSSFSLANATQVIPWVSEKNKAISQTKINQMLATNFYSFRNLLGISQDFRVELEINNVTTGYGTTPPLGYDVYVKETHGIKEDNNVVKIRVLTW